MKQKTEREREKEKRTRSCNLRAGVSIPRLETWVVVQVVARGPSPTISRMALMRCKYNRFCNLSRGGRRVVKGEREKERKREREGRKKSAVRASQPPIWTRYIFTNGDSRHEQNDDDVDDDDVEDVDEGEEGGGGEGGRWNAGSSGS